MKTIDEATLEMWLDLEATGELEEAERVHLAAALRERPELADALRQQVALQALLAESRIPVAPGWSERVMAELPAAAWEARRAPAPWALPVAVLVLAAVGATFLLGESLSHGGHVVDTGLTVFDFLQTALLAGAGMLTASWRGLGMGLEELFAGSGLSLVALAAVVLCLDLLFFALLRRRPTRAAQTAEESSGRSPDERS